MNGRSIIAAALALAGAAGAAAAQDGTVRSECQQTDIRRFANDLCQKAVDIFSLVAPQFGTSIAGGNAVLGTGGHLGGFGHFSVGVRLNGIKGTIPDFEEGFTVAAGNASKAQPIPTRSQALGAPAAELAVSLFPGVPLGLTRLGGLDAIVSANYIPNLSGDNWELNVDNPLKLGYGARLGILKEGLVVPGLGVSYLRRDLPEVGFASFSSGGASRDSIWLDALKVKTSAWRVTASKRLLVVGIAAGVGRDSYDMSTRVTAVTHPTSGTAAALCATGACAISTPMEAKIDRMNYFVDLSLNLPVLKLVGEVGQVSGGTLDTYNRFGDARADDSRLYGSVGLRLGFPPF